MVRIKKVFEMNNNLLPEYWQNYMQNLPETGMGYHLVDIKTSDNTYQGVVVLNSNTVKSKESIDLEDIKDIKMSQSKNEQNRFRC